MRNYRLHFIRHGLIEANFTGQYIGRLDVPLCRRGLEELAEKRARYEYPAVGRVYVSPMQRCRQTAAILYPDQETVVVDNLAECHFGVFEGRYPDELKSDPAFVKWLENSAANPPEGGEGVEEFAGRCIAAFGQIFKDMMGDKVYEAAAITHGGVIATLRAAMAFPRQGMLQWKTKSGEGYTVLIAPDLWMRSGTVEVFGAVPARERAQQG